jgi:hypothetical protein
MADDLIVLQPDGFECEDDGRMVKLRIVDEEGIDLLWSMSILQARALAGDLTLIADEAEGLGVKH